MNSPFNSVLSESSSALGHASTFERFAENETALIQAAHLSGNNDELMRNSRFNLLNELLATTEVGTSLVVALLAMCALRLASSFTGT